MAYLAASPNRNPLPAENTTFSIGKVLGISTPNLDYYMFQSQSDCPRFCLFNAETCVMLSFSFCGQKLHDFINLLADDIMHQQAIFSHRK